jgi:hypothetical protein
VPPSQRTDAPRIDPDLTGYDARPLLEGQGYRQNLPLPPDGRGLQIGATTAIAVAADEPVSNREPGTENALGAP